MLLLHFSYRRCETLRCKRNYYSGYAEEEVEVLIAGYNSASIVARAVVIDLFIFGSL
jgi:hypothetical protein